MPSSASAYGRLDRLLHRLALGARPILELSFDIERARYARPAAALHRQPPVFVTGLARAGTTVLMRLIHEADDFAALRYRDLPFPLAPNSWASVSARWRRTIDRSERGHGDGLEHDLDSPEAIEEVFWRTHEGQRFLKSAGLVPHDPAPETMDAFADYLGLVCLRYGRDRYLSKNNANVLRLPALARRFPDAVIVHPFRNPLDQAASLLEQHQRACRLAREDRFRGDFMRWLGHHEFGAHQRPFLLPAGAQLHGSPDTLGFWLQTWTGVHRHLLDQPGSVGQAQVFIDYDALVTGDAHLLDGIRSRLQLARAIDATMLRAPAPRVRDSADVPEAVIDEAWAVHAALTARTNRTSAPALFATPPEPLSRR